MVFYPKEIALHEKLRRLVIEPNEQPLTIGGALSQLAMGSNDFGIPLLLLSLPGSLPVPAFGLKSLVGIVVTLLGLQMFIGKRTVWLPHWFTHIRLRPDWSQHAACMGQRFLPRLERFVNPRMNWMKYRIGLSLVGIIVIFLGLMMILSIIPGTKIIASLILLTLSIGLTESDGLLTLLAIVMALVLAVLSTEVVYLLIIWLAEWL